MSKRIAVVPGDGIGPEVIAAGMRVLEKINDQVNDSPPAKGERESIQGYFRKIFQENPKLLQTRSNEELLKRWLADHPGAGGVPYSVKIGLQNIKSVFRSRRRKRKAVRAVASTAPRQSPSRNGLKMFYLNLPLPISI